MKGVILLSVDRVTFYVRNDNSYQLYYPTLAFNQKKL